MNMSLKRLLPLAVLACISVALPAVSATPLGKDGLAVRQPAPAPTAAPVPVVPRYTDGLERRQTFERRQSATGAPVHPGASSALCLNAASNSDGAIVTVSTCVSGSTAQTWQYTGGTLRAFGTKCLDVPSGNTANGVKLQIWTCDANNANPNQQFFVTADARIAWTNHGECLDLTDGSTASGNQVQMWACSNGNNNQVWNFGSGGTTPPPPSSTITTAPTNPAVPVTINNVQDTSKCLTAASTANGAGISINTCIPESPSQAWQFVSNTWRAYGKCLDLPNGSAVVGQALQLWQCGDGNPNQQWTVTGSGEIQFGTSSGFCLVPSGNSVNSGTGIVLAACTTTNTFENWSFVEDH